MTKTGKNTNLNTTQMQQHNDSLTASTSNPGKRLMKLLSIDSLAQIVVITFMIIIQAKLLSDL